MLCRRAWLIVWSIVLTLVLPAQAEQPSPGGPEIEPAVSSGRLTLPLEKRPSWLRQEGIVMAGDWDRNNAEAAAYHRQIVRFAVEEMQVDLLHFGNYVAGPGMEPNSMRRSRRYLAENFTPQQVEVAVRVPAARRKERDARRPGASERSSRRAAPGGRCRPVHGARDENLRDCGDQLLIVRCRPSEQGEKREATARVPPEQRHDTKDAQCYSHAIEAKVGRRR